MKNTRTIHVVGAHETNAPWGFENKIIPALGRLGYDVRATDFRKHREDLAERLSEPADLFLVCRGDGIPSELIRTLPGITALWYAEQLGTLQECDEQATQRRTELSLNVAAFDHVFSHDQASLPVYEQLGARNAGWVPTAVVDPKVNRRVDASFVHDVVFTGTTTPYRTQVLEELKAHGISVAVVNSWDPVELNRVYNESKIVLNIHLSSTPNTESRIAEVLGAGAFLISQELSSPSLVRDGVDYVAWRGGSVSELAGLIRRFLENDQERRAIAESGHTIAHSQMTVDRRLLDLIGMIDFAKAHRLWPGNSFGVLHAAGGEKTLRMDDFYTAVRGRDAAAQSLNVILVAHNYLPKSKNGTEIHTFETAKELKRRGHTVRVLHADYAPGIPEGSIRESEYGGIPTTLVAVAREHEYVMENPVVAGAVASYASETKADVVHFQHSIGVSALSVNAVADRGISTVMTVRDAWLLCDQIHLVHSTGEYCLAGPESMEKCARCHIARNGGEASPAGLDSVRAVLERRTNGARAAFHAADEIIVSSRFMRSVLEKSGFRHAHLRVVPHGVREFGVQPWKRDNRVLRFAFLGGIYHTKGLDVAIRAFRSIAAPDIALHIHGHPVHDRYFKEWIEEAERDSRVRYAGPYDEQSLGSILAESDVVIVPSRFESYCHVVREALHARVPVIASNIGGIPEAVNHGVNGLLVTPGDVDELARAISVFVNDRTKAEEFRKRIGPVHGMQENVDEIEQVYREVRARSSAGNAVAHAARRADAATRLIAFHLPQFHPIPENDRWWGKGFTEWTNVAKAKPLFEGHYQPHLPADLGFYDLRLREARRAQGELARAHGIEGFCFWHYWFDGKLLLERPLLEMLETGDPDISFCLAWANENWTRRWDGQEQEIIQPQTYGGERDDAAHFRWLLPFFRDHRAVRIDGKPVFLIYRPANIPQVSQMIARWRSLARDAGLPGLFLLAIKTSFEENERSWIAEGFDGEVLFQPNFGVALDVAEQHQRSLGVERLPGDPIVAPYAAVWPELAKLSARAAKDDRFFASVVPGWDNTPRRAKNPLVWHEASPEEFQKWLTIELRRVEQRPFDRRLVFLNAWNEWAEGNHLEPDQRHGAGYLKADRSALREVASASIDVSEVIDGARVLSSEGRLHDAIAALEQAVHSGVKDGAIANELAVLHYRIGRTREAVEQLERAHALAPRDTNIRKNLAELRTADGRIDEAADLLRGALAVDPHDADLHVAYAGSSIQRGLVEEALVHVARALALDPQQRAAADLMEALERRQTDRETSSEAGRKNGHLPVRVYRSLGEYRASRDADRAGRRMQEEREQYWMAHGDEFAVPGHCAVCGAESSFLVDLEYAGERNGIRVPNWRERMVCPTCGLNNRMRAALHIAKTELGLGQGKLIYVTEQSTSLYHQLRQRFGSVEGSEFLGNAVPLGGVDGRGIRNEDLTRLTYRTASFDAILSFEVLEHIPAYDRAFAECCRVLRPGGIFLFSVPFAPNSYEHVVRARVRDDGSVEHLLPPEYHGDPLSQEGCLAYYHFGWRILDDLLRAGFGEPRALGVWSEFYGYLGPEQVFFAAIKPATTKRDVADGTGVAAAVVKERFAKAIELRDAGDHPGAEAALREVVRLDPHYAEAYNELAAIRYHAGDTEDARRILRDGAANVPGDVTIVRNLADVSLECSDAEGARDAAFRILQLAPDDVDAYFTLGSAMLSLKLYARAADYFQRVKRLNPDHPHIDDVLAALPKVEQHKRPVQQSRSRTKK